MNRLQFVLIWILGCAAAFAAAPVQRPQHNFLFIVDSSISMEQRKPAAIKLVRDVITSRFDGQLEAGDSIDIWTYDTENNLRGYPPQIWSLTNATRIVDSATKYLEQHRFKGRSEFANVATDLDILVPQTKSLLIVIITDGEQPFAGINLDLEINGYLAKKGKIGAETKEPLLVSLAAINGAIRTWTAYFGEGKLALASLPGRQEKARIAAAPPIQKAKPAVKPAVKEPVVKLDASPSASYATFNYPPGTRFNHVETAGVPQLKGREKTLAQAVAERLAKSAVTKAAITSNPAGFATNSAKHASGLASGVQKTNLAMTNGPTVLAAANMVATNITSNVLKAGSNSVERVAFDHSNSVAAASTAPVPPSQSQPENFRGATRLESHHVSARAGSLSHGGLLRRAVYIFTITGFSCVLLGIYLLYRKLRRPTQSIISRSLLQR